MKNTVLLGVLLLSLFCYKSVHAQKIKPAMPPANFKSAFAEVNGVKLHYVIGGSGDLLVLLHGFGEDWYTWNRVLPEFSKHFTVLVPDLRGSGESAKPATGYDKKTLAFDIHELVKKLGYKNILLAGHDIGLMVAYNYAATYSDEVKKLSLMDAAIPGIEPTWGEKRKVAWWFGFYSWSYADTLLAGRERDFLNHFWAMVSHVKNAFTEEEKNEFVRAYKLLGGMKSGLEYYRTFAQDSIDNVELAKHKLTMPLLAMGGEYTAPTIGDECRLVADNVKEVIIKGSGHWLVEEKPAEVTQALIAFFIGK